MTELLGEQFNLKEVFPERSVFHVKEYLGIQGVAVGYHAHFGDFDEAERRLRLMHELGGESSEYVDAYVSYRAGLAKLVKARNEQEAKTNITPVHTFKVDPSLEIAGFQLKESELLYSCERPLDEVFFKRYLQLDRQQVVSDLEGILKRSHFNKEASGIKLSVQYALALLGELESTESLPVILDMLREDHTYYEIYLGEAFLFSGWMSLLRLFRQDLNSAKEFLKLPGLDYVYRSVVLQAVEQLGLHDPTREEEVMGIFQELLRFFNGATLEDNVIDTEFSGLLVRVILDRKLSQFLPLVKSLYEKGFVTEGVCGAYERVEEKFLSDKESKEKYSFYEILKDIEVAYEAYLEKGNSAAAQKAAEHSAGATSNIGRNDPCPCGSGKKYKRCCQTS